MKNKENRIMNLINIGYLFKSVSVLIWVQSGRKWVNKNLIKSIHQQT